MMLIHASWLVTGDADAIADAAVVLDATGAVLDVGSAADVLPRHAGVKVQRVDGVLMPALINAHTHLELSWMRGLVPGGAGFVPWVERLVTLRRNADPEEVSMAIDRGCDELVACGTAAVGDVANDSEAAAALARRAIGGWFFHEVRGVAPDHGRGSFESARADVQAPAPLRKGIVPHALYTTDAALVADIAAEARKHGTLISLHLAEHADERAFLRDRSGHLAPSLARVHFDHSAVAVGASPIDCAARIGLLGPDLLAVHLADARRAELDQLAASGVRAVLCPRSNLYIQTLLPPLLDILAAGLRPGLGTDSLASNTSLDVLAEAAALRARFPTVPLRTLFAMATAWSAEALGLAALGRIAIGARPGIVLVAPKPGTQAIEDPFAHVIASAPGSRRWLTRAFDPIAPPVA